MRWICLALCISVLFGCVGCSRDVGAPLQTGVVLIDPGHGGFDGGAVAEDGTTEKHLNLAIAQCLRDMLYISGVSVEMTRQTDIGLEDSCADSIREKKSSDMQQRLSMYEEADLVISIHQNHFTIPKYSGTQVFYSPNHPDSVTLAETIRQSIIKYIQPQNTRELKQATDGIYLLYHTDTPTVLVECGFLSNPEEREKLKMPAYQQQMAFSILAGFWNYHMEK